MREIIQFYLFRRTNLLSNNGSYCNQ